MVLYLFPTDDHASNFMARSEDAVNCPNGIEYTALEIVEGEHLQDDVGPTMDGFADEFDPKVPWEVSEHYSIGGAESENTDDAFFVQRAMTTQISVDGVSYGERQNVLSQYENLGQVVLVTVIWGRCCSYGYGNAAAYSSDILPDYNYLSEFADSISRTVFAELAR